MLSEIERARQNNRQKKGQTEREINTATEKETEIAINTKILTVRRERDTNRKNRD